MTVSAPLYSRVMGRSWSQIAEPLRCMHATYSTVSAHGRLRVEYGAHPLARLVARLLRLPEPGAAVDTRLVITPHADGEHWARMFEDRCVETWQYQCEAGGLAERFGVIEFRFHLQTSGGGLVYVQRDAAFVWPVRVRIPASWAPCVVAREDPEEANRIRVDVHVMVPGIGALISYAGVVDVEARL